MGLDDEALARELGAPPEMVVRLAMCKRPDVMSASFESDLRDLSDYTQADEQVLSRVIEAWSRVEGSTGRANASTDIRVAAGDAISRRRVSFAERAGICFHKSGIDSGGFGCPSSDSGRSSSLATVSARRAACIGGNCP
jgi:hypothetical protein